MSNNKITIDGKEYNPEDLSDDVKNSLQSIQWMDGNIRELQREIAATKTAKNGYTYALTNDLPEKETEDENNLIIVGDKKYAMSDLSQKAQGSALFIRTCDQELNRLDTKLAIAQTARNAYAKSVKDALATMAKKEAH